MARRRRWRIMWTARSGQVERSQIKGGRMPSIENTSARDQTSDMAGSYPQFATETKLMQYYRAAAAAHGGSAIAMLRNGAGGIEIFTTATDGKVWNFYPDSTSDTGYKSVVTPLSGQNVAAGVDDNGRIVVLANNDLTLNYIMETGQADPNSRWSAVGAAKIDFTANTVKIEKIMTTSVAGHLSVALISYYMRQGNMSQREAYYCTWNATPAQAFTLADPFAPYSAHVVWTGTDPSNLALTCLESTCLSFLLATKTTVVSNYIPPPPFYWPSSLTVETDGRSVNEYFTVMDSGTIARYRSDYAQYQWTALGEGQWPPNLQPPRFRVIASVRADDLIQLFGLTDTGRVYHIASQPGDMWDLPVPLHANVAGMAVCLSREGNIELVLVGQGQGTMIRMVRDKTSGDWQKIEVDVPSQTAIEKISAYATDVTILGADGAPLANAPIEVRASAEVEVTVGGAVYVIDPLTPARLMTNGAGRIAIAQPTDSLGVATLTFGLPNLMQAGQSVAVRQFAGVQASLAAVDQDKLLAATDASGAQLLKGKYRDPETAKALAKKVTSCMALAGSTQIALRADGVTMRARKLGTGTHAVATAEHLDRIIISDAFTHWTMSFDDGAVRYQELTARAAQALFSDTIRAHASAADAPFAIRSLGDLVRAIGDGIATVTNAALTTLGNSIQAAITFVIDGITYVLNSIVELVDQLFDLVEVAFVNVQVTFQQISEWVGFVFSWDDILRTHVAYAYAVAEFLNFLPLAVAGIQARIDTGITQAIAQLDATFDGLVTQLGTGNMGTLAKNNEMDDPTFSSGIANNQFLDATMSNGRAAMLRLPTRVTATGDGPLDEVLKELQALAGTLSALPEFRQAQEIFQNLRGDVTQVLSSIGAGLLRILQGVAKAILMGIKAAVDKLLALLSGLIQSVLDLLTAEVEIPFVSSFYQSVTNAKLTALDLSALLAAIPTTVIYKAVTQAAPFPDQASVEQFKATFNRHTLLARSGLGPAGAAVTVSAPGANFVKLLWIGSNISNLLYGWASMLPDLAEVDVGAPVTTPVVLASTVALGFEIGGTFCGCPWWSSEPGLNCPGKTKDDAEKWLWLHGLAGVGLDIAFFVKDRTFPENNNTFSGTIIALIYGATRAVVWGTQLELLNMHGKVGYGAEVVVACLKILRLPGLARPSTLLALAAADFLGALISGAAGFTDPPSDPTAFAIAWIPGAVPRAGRLVGPDHA
jgi:hypothetical protein